MLRESRLASIAQVARVVQIKSPSLRAPTHFHKTRKSPSCGLQSRLQPRRCAHSFMEAELRHATTSSVPAGLALRESVGIGWRDVVFSVRAAQRALPYIAGIAADA